MEMREKKMISLFFFSPSMFSFPPNKKLIDIRNLKNPYPAYGVCWSLVRNCAINSHNAVRRVENVLFRHRFLVHNITWRDYVIIFINKKGKEGSMEGSFSSRREWTCHIQKIRNKSRNFWMMGKKRTRGIYGFRLRQRDFVLDEIFRALLKFHRS